MIKTKDLRTVYDCAELYKRYLLDKDIMIVYLDRQDGKLKSLEHSFEAGNFQHLTGIEYTLSGASHFFQLALEKRLPIESCSYKADGTTPLKLEILPTIVSIPYKATMIGNYNDSKLNIFANKAYGNVYASLLIKKDNNNIYRPISALKSDIRNLATKANPIKLILIKDNNEALYKTKCKIAKKFDINSLPKEIKDKIDISNLGQKYEIDKRKELQRVLF